MSIFALIAIFTPLFLGAALVILVLVVLRGAMLVRSGRIRGSHRLDVHQLQDRVSQLNRDLQEIKEQIADLTIQLDDPRFR